MALNVSSKPFHDSVKSYGDTGLTGEVPILSWAMWHGSGHRPAALANRQRWRAPVPKQLPTLHPKPTAPWKENLPQVTLMEGPGHERGVELVSVGKGVVPGCSCHDLSVTPYCKAENPKLQEKSLKRLNPCPSQLANLYQVLEWEGLWVALEENTSCIKTFNVRLFLCIIMC